MHISKSQSEEINGIFKNPLLKGVLMGMIKNGFTKAVPYTNKYWKYVKELLSKCGSLSKIFKMAREITSLKTNVKQQNEILEIPNLLTQNEILLLEELEERRTFNKSYIEQSNYMKNLVSKEIERRKGLYC